MIVAATRAGKVLAWLPIPLFLVALAVFSIRATDTAYGTPFLLITLNLVFGAFTSFIVFTLVSRSFLLRGTPDLLLIGCGALVWGCTALISTSANIQDVNVTVTIYNLGTILSAFCHALGSLLTGRAKPAFRSSGLTLTAACVIVLALLFLAALGTLEQWTPVFFIQGTGGTPIRQTIVALSAACFLFAGVVIRLRQGQRVSPFAWWYSISTMLIAVGLAGLLLQYSFGTPVNWVARAAQYLGCTYMLAAAVLSAKDARDWEVSLTDELSQTKHRYANLFHLAADGIAIHELGDTGWFGHILEANPALCEMLGYTAGELQSLDPAVVDAASPSRQPVVESAGPALRRELTLRRKDGTTLLAEINTRLFRENHRDIAMSIVRDITARKAAEEQLRELAVRLSYHVENTPLAVIEWGPDMRITHWSSGAERLFGWNATEVIGKRMEDFRWIFPDDQALVASVSTDLQSGRTHSFLANRNYRKDGSVVHCEWYNSSLVDDRGKLRSIQSLVLDVSARTEAEAGLRRLNTELEQFAYAVSHDLQEPLRNIIIFSDLLRRRTGAELSADAARDLGFVVAGAHQINHLLTGLRSYLQITQQTAAAEHADPVGVLQQVLASLESRIARENATVTAADLPAVAVSTVHLYQLFQNLIANALKFRSSAPPTISVTAQPDGSMIRFAVADNGIGIDPRYVSQIFGVFRRLHGRERYEGSGIGLAICHKIVDRYGGRIWVESSEGAGSTFFFTLPPAATPSIRRPE